MDQLPNPHRARLRPMTLVMLFAAVALVATAWLAPHVFAQTIDAGKAAKAPGATVTTPAAEAIEGAPGKWEGVIKVAIVIALFVVPTMVGSWLAKTLRMPEHGWKFAIAIGTVAAAAVVVSTGEIKLGPDLSGGITLIYELAEDSSNALAADDAKDAAKGAGDAKAKDGKDADESDEAGDADAKDQPVGPDGQTPRDTIIANLIAVLTERIDPSGTKEISIRRWGEDSIEIVIPRAEKQELEFIERKISTAGSLIFRITASREFSAHRDIIEQALELPTAQDIYRIDGKEYARWVEVDRAKFPTEDDAIGLVTRTARNKLQALVMTNDGLDVTGEYLKGVASGTDQVGKPQVEFSFNSKGAFLFGQLTGEHKPSANDPDRRYRLGILLDNRLLSAPNINDKITDSGTISGNMTEEDVNFLVGILQAGSLPAALNPIPISRAQISPTLGAQTIEMGRFSLTISLILVALFMLLYYRRAGFIACFGLAINMLLIVGCMVLIKAAFTLPGLAGLVLTVGMSVDANVLIYERIRDELKRGAALRMAIRNGFDRASITIIDSNVTNLITGIVIYKIAPDNVKGFGITLVLGIAMSIFVAVFLTRIAFDVAERKGWLKGLYMMEFIGETKMDFLSWRKACIMGSLLVIGIGMFAVVSRKDDLLDIDFTGGSSVQFVLKDDEAMNYDAVLAALTETSLEGKNLSLVKLGEGNTHYSVTTIDDNIAEVEGIVAETFAGKLETYEVEVTAPEPLPAESAGMAPRGQSLRFGGELAAPMSLVALLQAAPANEAAAETADDAAKAGEDAAAETAPAEDTTLDADAATEEEADADDADATTEDAATGTPAAEADGEAADDAETAEDGAADTESDNPFAAGGVSSTVRFGTPDRVASDALSAGVSYETIQQLLTDALDAEGFEDVAYEITNEEYESGSGRNFVEWDVKLALPEADAQRVLAHIEGELDNQPIFPLSNKIGGRVASRMATDAVAAIILCLAGIIGYVWFRFHGVMYGVAAVVALIHDVLVALGFVALSAYLVLGAEPIANALLIDKFQVSLTLVAAFLTIIGYSLNDTIVIFDRIREVKGKSPRLTAEMINLALNQCFARTLLTSFTSLISVTVLYFFGGAGIHAFAFALMIGFIAGVYSTIYIANPVLLWLTQRADAAAAKGAGSRAA